MDGLVSNINLRLSPGHGGVEYLLPHFPQALQTIEHVAAPQQLAAKDISCWTRRHWLVDIR